MTSNPKAKANRGNALRSTGLKTRSASKRPKARREADKPTKKKTAKDNLPSIRAATPSGRLKSIGGSVSDAFNNTIIDQMCRSLWVPYSDRDKMMQHGIAARSAMVGIKPRDEVEGMLAVQMVALHNAAMECFQRAKLEGQTFEGRRENLNQANKLSHSYATLIEALDRHRGKGQQHVTVEHVHVNQGGQAIVGALSPRGGGVSRQTEEQPHAKGITHETGIPMPRPDPERKVVPIRGRKGKVSL
jgi:hypothetical protein